MATALVTDLIKKIASNDFIKKYTSNIIIFSVFYMIYGKRN